MLMSSPKDTRMMVVYGYARLVAYTPALAIVPDMLLAVDVEEGRIFTLHLRRRPQMVGRQALHLGGFPLLVRGCRQQPRAVDRPACRRQMLAERRAAQIRGHRRDDGALYLGEPEPAVPARAGRTRSALHLLPGALSEAVPREIRRQGRSWRSWSRRAGVRNWAALHTKLDSSTGTTIRSCRPWSLGC